PRCRPSRMARRASLPSFIAVKIRHPLRRGHMRRSIGILLFLSTAILASAPSAQGVKIGFVTFLSGPAAAPFGIPARNAVELVVADLNAGKVPAPYNTKGFGGAAIEAVIIDEAGST